MKTYGLSKYPLQEYLHDDRRVWEDRFNNLGFGVNSAPDFNKQVGKAEFCLGRRNVWVGNCIPSGINGLFQHFRRMVVSVLTEPCPPLPRRRERCL